MKKSFLLGLASYFLVFSCVASADSVVDRGRYLAIAADCAGCHTRPGGGAPFAGGYGIDSPLGTIWSSNITPSQKHGIGAYSESDFGRALREGIRKDGAHLYPAMPYTAYVKLSDEDVHALYVYFNQAVAVVDTAAPQTRLPFPFNLRFSMAVWNAMFLDRQRFTANPSHDERWNRGAYLVEGLEHCSSCHTPRGLLMQELRGHTYAGGQLGPWYAPNITSDKTSGIGAWGDDDLAQYLKTGRVPGKAQAAGGMAEAVTHSLSKLNDEDIAAIVSYLRTVPAVSDEGATRAAFAWGKPGSDESEIRGAGGQTPTGAMLYSGLCASCHGARGTGSSDGYYPSLLHNTTVGASRPDNLISVILFGVDREVAGQHILMPNFSDGSDVQALDNIQIATLVTYVRRDFGPGGLVSADDVGLVRKGGAAPPLLALVHGGLLLAILLLIVLVVGWTKRNHRKARAST
jgi:fructose 5-dehydrogenase cytochrome subunit